MIYSVWFLEGIISEVVGCVLFLYFYLFLSLFQIISPGFLVKFFLLCLRCHSRQCQMFIIPYIHNFVPFIYIIYYHFVCCILEDWCWFHILDCVVILFGFFLFRYHSSKKSGVDTGCFWHWYTDFGHTNLGVPKFDHR